MKVAFDDSHIFTAGEDGMLMIFEIRDKVFFWFLLMDRREHKKEIKKEQAYISAKNFWFLNKNIKKKLKAYKISRIKFRNYQNKMN